MIQKIKQDGLYIGENMQRLRKQYGISQEKLAARLQLMKIDLNRETISQMERGICNVRVSVLVALAHMYNVSYDEFFKGLKVEDISEISGKAIDN